MNLHDESSAGLLITWTCYGTWLPGDRRGHVSDTVDHHGRRTPKRNQPGTPYAPGDPHTEEMARARQKWATVRLSAELAFVVAGQLISAALAREWIISQAAVMYNHTHVVVAGCSCDAPSVRRVFKGTTQAALSQHHGNSRRWWTRGGSDRYLQGARAVQAAIQYVSLQKGVLAGIADMEAFRSM